MKKIFLIAVIITLWASPVFAVEEMVEEEHFYRGRVLSINEMEVEEHDFFSIYQQEVVVLLTSGPFRGKTVNIINTHFAEDQVYDLALKENQEVIVVTIGEEGSFEQVHIQDLARDRGIYYLIGVFILVVLVVGRMKGIKTLVALAVTLGLIMGGFLPLLLQGYSPILLAIGLASIAITFTLLLIGGFNLKSLTAILGTIAGVIIAGLMAFWAGSIAQLTGFGTEEAQMLFFMDQTIDLRGLLFAGIIVGSLGAMTDIGMSVSSAATEIKRACPNIRFRELTVSALNVGRDVMGTMANTLILAYVGASIPMLLLVMGYQIDWLKVINMDMIATEFVRGIAGSIGVVMAVPITAVLAGFFLTSKKKDG